MANPGKLVWNRIFVERFSHPTERVSFLIDTRTQLILIIDHERNHYSYSKPGITNKSLVFIGTEEITLDWFEGTFSFLANKKEDVSQNFAKCIKKHGHIEYIPPKY